MTNLYDWQALAEMSLRLHLLVQRVNLENERVQRELSELKQLPLGDFSYPGRMLVAQAEADMLTRILKP